MVCMECWGSERQAYEHSSQYSPDHQISIGLSTCIAQGTIDLQASRNRASITFADMHIEWTIDSY